MLVRLFIYLRSTIYYVKQMIMGLGSLRVDTYTPNPGEDPRTMDKDPSCKHCVTAAADNSNDPLLQAQLVGSAQGRFQEDSMSKEGGGHRSCGFESPFLALRPALRAFQAIGIFNFSVFSEFSDFVCR